MNVLLTSAGRRNYLIGYFKEALRLIGIRGAVFAGDADPMAVALGEADEAIVLPPFRSGEYVEALLGLCANKGIQLVIPLNDVELPILAAATERFYAKGVRVVVSSPEVIDTCFDKLRMGEFLEGLGLPVPRSYLSLAAAKEAVSRGDISFPLVVKPRWGSGSIGLEFVETESELALAYQFSRHRIRRSVISHPNNAVPDQNVLIQERISGVEYGLDVVNDFSYSNAGVLIRRKISMRSGETDKAITSEDPALSALGRLIGEHLGHLGNLDCDVIVGTTGSYVIDMNPRFGGGYPFAHVAGANIPACLLCWSLGLETNEQWLQAAPGIASGKCDRLVPIGSF